MFVKDIYRLAIGLRYLWKIQRLAYGLFDSL